MAEPPMVTSICFEELCLIFKARASLIEIYMACINKRLEPLSLVFLCKGI